MNFENDKPFQRDFDFVQQLIAGDPKAWNYFYNRIRPSIKIFLKQKFASFLDDVGRESICDKVQDEFIANDYKILRGFGGLCPFQVYVNKRADWRARDFLLTKGRSLRAYTAWPDPLPSLESNPLSALIESEDIPIDESELMRFLLEEIPDELRWTFLVRYRNYLDFPELEIRKLSAARNWSLQETTRRLACAVSTKEDASVQKKLHRFDLLQKRLERFLSKLREIEEDRDRLRQSGLETSRLDEEKEVVCRRIASLQHELQSKRMLITTKYELISEILGEPNLNTLRSRVMQVLNLINKRFLHRDGTSTKTG